MEPSEGTPQARILGENVTGNETLAEVFEGTLREGDPCSLIRSAQELAEEITAVSEQADVLMKNAERGLVDGSTSLRVSGEALGVDEVGMQSVFDAAHFSLRTESFRDRLRQSADRLQEAAKRGAGIATTAWALGIATPMLAETAPLSLEALMQSAVSTERVERPPLPMYEKVKQQFRDSILTAPAEERAIFVRTKDGGPMSTMILKRGQSVSVGFTEEENVAYEEAMHSRTAVIEDVHTHPISALKHVGLIDEDKAEAMSRGELPPASAEPSAQDWNMLFTDDSTYNFPPGQISHRVIDGTGEWEYGVSDSSSPFILGMRKTQREFSKITDLGLSADDQRYLEGVIAENETVFHALEKVMNGQGEQASLALRQKLLDHVGPVMAKNVSPKDIEKYAELTQPLSTSMNSEERRARILRMEAIAPSLGFRLTYTPHTSGAVPETP